MRIVVDDDKDLFAIIKIGMERAGLKIRGSTDSVEALAPDTEVTQNVNCGLLTLERQICQVLNS
jgi:hypothetical protein